MYNAYWSGPEHRKETLWVPKSQVVETYHSEILNEECIEITQWYAGVLDIMILPDKPTKLFPEADLKTDLDI